MGICGDLKNNKRKEIKNLNKNEVKKEEEKNEDKEEKNDNISEKENKEIKNEINGEEEIIKDESQIIKNDNDNNSNKGKEEEEEYNDYYKPIPINIANKVIKSICKIIVKKEEKDDIYGTGFFMKISSSKNCLITNYHIISKDKKSNIEIEIHNQKKMNLVLKKRYIKYFPEPKDITIIEIKNTDEIYNDIEFLDYDNKKREEYIKYENEYVFSIEHPLGGNAACASGKIINVYEYEFEHNVGTDNGSSGCPIILLNDNNNLIKVIGIHKLADEETNLNCGTFIGEIF